ncbi:MAG: hypothetical protein GDA68_12085 [Nitrospira sp. CR2.1]|nr:hypothetical protein [Nitrospira sp. CR2.1]
MRSSHFKGIVWIVALAVIALLAVTTGSAVAHELQHAAHHDAAMHGSGICAWMCATAGVHVVTPLHATHLFSLSGEVGCDSDRLFFPQSHSLSESRAPPFLA